jgi:hypothetical protein
MKSTIIALVAVSIVAGCGTGKAVTRAVFAPATLDANGPIKRACLAQDRSAATSSRCGCVQAVADRELTNAQQRRGVKAFKDPHKMQQWRQSDRASDNAFWDVWKAYGQTAARLCSS